MRQAAAPLSDAAVLAKRARHQLWHWCRLTNHFFDNPLWRVVSELTGLPLYQVQAFVGRLECLANRSEPRGYVGDFRAAEFGAALGMSAEQAARIFAALEHVDVAWIDQDHVASFDGRNPDRPDVTAPERDRRRNAREQVRKNLDRRFERGDITDEQRDAGAAMVGLLADRELFELRDKLRAGVALEAALSTVQGHAVGSRGFVGSHARAEQSRSQKPTAAVDNSGAATRGEAQGLAEEQQAPDDAQSTDAELWLSTEAVRIVTERMGVLRQRAATLIERWRRDLDEPVALARVIAGCDDGKLGPAQFHVLIGQHLDRCRTARDLGEPLPLPPVRNFGTDPLRVANPQAEGHAVAGVAVDKPAAPQSNPAASRSGTDG